MWKSYFRTQQDLVALIEPILKQKPSVEDAQAIGLRAWKIVEDSGDRNVDDLYDIVMEFCRWLDDGDIRERDAAYAASTTERLSRWCQQNKHLNSH